MKHITDGMSDNQRIELICEYILENRGHDYNETIAPFIDDPAMGLTTGEIRAYRAWSRDANYIKEDFKVFLLKANKFVKHVYAQAWLIDHKIR